MGEPLGVDKLLRQIVDTRFQHFNDGSSDSDSDVLLAGEDEAKECPITRKYVELFDKIKKRRRILEKINDSDEDSIDTSDITHEYFTEMFRSHIKRKKLRRKIRNQPPDQVHARHIRSISWFLFSFTI